MMILEEQQEFLKNNKIDYNKRIYNLSTLKSIIQKYEADISQALYLDLGKSKMESYMTEIGMVYDEINYFLKNLKKLMKAKSVKLPITVFPAKGKILYEPLGSILIISPWNYPFQLAVLPLVGAIAAGNTAVLKLSEYSFHTNKVIKKMLSEVFNSSYVAVFDGDQNIVTSLLEQKFDLIFFTGSPWVGKIIMEKASKNLTPVVLELGGKSPVIVTNEADIKLAAKRIIWGKFLNAGQTCIAPDYVYVDTRVKDELILSMKLAIREAFGDSPLINKDYPKIISNRHLTRLEEMLVGNNVIHGGNKLDCKLEPTLILNPALDSKIMKEEIFGPILPIIEFTNLDDVIDNINDNEKPLALYLFSNSKSEQNKIINSISFGGGCINDTILHITAHNLPFGGVGQSGMGSYHGAKSFYTFSHEKSILVKGNSIDIKLRYFPFSDDKLKKIKKLLK